ncbi:MAG: protein translocase SEC61 complex subunit gamma [Thaumarchaeota archaeon]|nr:protein translocase SEC61 complex subunit gamma [Nitrososphaerota archaeon]
MADMGGFLRAMAQTLKLAHKSDKEEFFLYMKLTLLGVAVVGTMGYIIQLLGALLRLQG